MTVVTTPFAPILKDCHSKADTFEEALANIKDAVKLYLNSLKTYNEEILAGDISILRT